MKRKVKMAIQPPSFRPTVAGNHHAVATGHYLGTAAAMRILDGGGNAIDAGVTAAMALAMLQPDMVSFAGVAPTLIYLKKEDRVISLAGLGYWPAATDISRLIAEGNGEHVPEGLLRTVMPAAPATHIEALRRYGTISFEQAATAAMEIARDGFAVYPLLASNIEYTEEKFRRWPDNAKVFLPGNKLPKVGEILKQEDLARTIFSMIEAERNTRGDRDKKLRAVHDYFYRGPIAGKIADYHKRHDGFVTQDDLAAFEVPLEDSISVRYRDYEVHSCDVWCQGVVLLETLKTLEGYDLRALGHNSIDYVHVVNQALNLAFADREAYSGDPKFVTVPRAGMLSDAYAIKQRKRIDMKHAFRRCRIPAIPKARRSHSCCIKSEARGTGRRGTRAAAGNDLRLRHGSRRQWILSHVERSAVRHPDHQRHRPRDFIARMPVTPDPGTSERGRSGQTPAAHAQPVARLPRRQALHDVRHARR